ncbi:hypothetical protein HRI_003131300 [Hibiscus trionum]|nr:hypothetical protein HRI_003131300 [Hibiscus trionum]
MFVISEWRGAGLKDPEPFILESPTPFWLTCTKSTVLKLESVLLGNDKFMVTVYPNVDCAFMVALVAIHDGINHDEDGIE